MLTLKVFSIIQPTILECGLALEPQVLQSASRFPVFLNI